MIRSNRAIIPLALGLAIAVLAGSVVLVVRSRRSKESPSNESNQAFSASLGDKQIPVPELHVLSTNMIDENVMYSGGGRKIADVKILSPPNSQYTQAVARPGKQGVLQLSVKFDSDSSISEVIPVAKRSVCGMCLVPDSEATMVSQNLLASRKREGIEVVGIDPASPQSRDLIDAAVGVVNQIKFVPFQSAGRPVPTHGLVECVFRFN